MDPYFSSYYPLLSKNRMALADMDYDSGAPMPSSYSGLDSTCPRNGESWEIVNGLSYASTCVVNTEPETRNPNTLKLSENAQGAQSHHTLPPAREFFYGREHELRTIEAYFYQPSDSRKLHTFAVFGLGGVGKTSLALRYAYQCQQKDVFDCIFWINAETIASLRQNFTDIAYELEISSPEKNETPETHIFSVKKWLSNTSLSWLIIYDNLETTDTLLPHLPNGPGHVLVTTRYADVARRIGGSNRSLELKIFEPEQSYHIFDQLRLHYRHPDRFVPDADERELSAIRNLLSRLGGLPVGIEHVAAYIECDELTVVEFNKKYERMAGAIHERRDTGSNSQHTLTTLWQVSLQQTRDQYPDAFRLLTVLSMLAPDEISLSLFDFDDESEEKTFSEALDSYSDFCKDIECLESAVSQLKKHAIIKRSGNQVSLHRLLQDAVIFSMNRQDFQRAFNSTVRLLNHAFPKSVKSSFLLEKWPECAAVVQHVISVANRFFDASKQRGRRLESTEELRELSKNAAWYLSESGQSMEARRLAEQGLDMCSEKESLIYAHFCNTLAVLHFQYNELSKALVELDEVLSIRQTLLEGDDLELATCYHNLSTLSGAQGDQNKSIEYIMTAMSTWKKQPEKTAVLLGLGKLISGRAFFNKSDYVSAKEWYDRAEVVFDREQGCSGLFSGDLAFAKGNLYLVQGAFNHAQKYYQAGYRISHNLAPRHILTASFLYKLGLISHLKREYSSSLSFLDQALDITTGTYKGDTLRTVRRKALVMRDDPASTTEQKMEAEAVLEQAEAVKKQLYEESGLTELKGGEICGIDEQEKEYDMLCCGYYR